MGNCADIDDKNVATGQDLRNISIATLNYSGILASPYEFFGTYSNIRLHDIFKQIVVKDLP